MEVVVVIMVQLLGLILSVLVSRISALEGVDFEEVDHYRDWQGGSGRQSVGQCGQGMTCTDISSCLLVKHLLDRSCLASDRLQQMICGVHNTDLLVCCPRGAFQSPFDDQTYPGFVPGGVYVPTTPSPPRRDQFTCGQPAVRTKIRGLGSHPWVARVGFLNVLPAAVSGSKAGQMNYPCAGSIISRTAILTAAHCALAKSDDHELYSVRIGEYDGEGEIDCTVEFCGPEVQDILIKKVTVHPLFVAKNFTNDVAILKLDTPMNFTVTAQPICLLQNPQLQLIGRQGQLVGWGKTPGQETTPTRQQLIELPVLPMSTCQKVYSPVIPVSNQQQLCVGGEEGKDACSGFGGAPLVMLDHVQRTRYFQVGSNEGLRAERRPCLLVLFTVPFDCGTFVFSVTICYMLAICDVPAR
ncbi:unnamed protein product [Timema podura]|uniref:Peptidase S1 domain-containing protein n=1 Tax=Timema podura TaxID=61482 RepID=A0ABN7NIK5_TIMPD|nr:unnamed protein product [Timema podura]